MNSTEHIIRLHEGREKIVYRDTLGHLTCGIGHLLREGSPVPDAAVDAFFQADMEEARDIYVKLNLDLDAVRQAAVINMCFNLGYKIFQFKKFLTYMAEDAYLEAGDELRDSKWWTQTGRRATDIYGMVVSGQWPTIPNGGGGW